MPIPANPRTKKELCQHYGICPQTLAKWLLPFLAELSITSALEYKKIRVFNLNQIRIIITKLG